MRKRNNITKDTRGLSKQCMPENVQDILNILEYSPCMQNWQPWENVHATKFDQSNSKTFLAAISWCTVRTWVDCFRRNYTNILQILFTREMLTPIIFCDYNSIRHIPWMFYFRWTCLPIIIIKSNANFAERYNI